MRTARRRQPRAAAVAVVMIVAGVGGLFVTASPAAADVDSVVGTGFGLSVAAAGSFVIPPTPDPTVTPPLLQASESSTDFGPHEASIVTLDGVLGILEDGVAVGPVVTQAGRIVGEDHGGFVATTSQVANVSILSDAIEIPLIVSSCVADGDGARGTTTLSNARIGTSPLLDGPVAPNTVIDVLGLATVVLNEQIVVNTPPSGGNPGQTQITVNAAHILIPADGSIAEIILAQSFCQATGPDVLLPATTVPPTTAPPTTVAPTTAPPTTAPPTTAPPTTVTPTTVTPTTVTPTTVTPTTVTPTTAAPATTTRPTPPLPRTGGNFQPMALLSGAAIVVGILLLVGSGQPAAAGAGRGGYVQADGIPENWGPIEIVKTLWAGLAALMLALARLAGGRRSRRR